MPATQWRVLGNSISGSYIEFCELEFRATPGGADQATGGNAIASSQFGSFQSSDRAFDGSNTTFWRSATNSDGEWIGQNFGTDTTVQEISITPNGADKVPATILIQKWNGASWETTDTYTGLTWEFRVAQTFSVTDSSGPDVTAPTLSSPSATGTAPSTADLSVSTDEGNGTLYWVVTQSATAPSAAQVKAGNDHTGSAADDSGSQTVSGTGTQNAEATGLSLSTTYYAHFMHEDAAANESTVASSASFETITEPPLSYLNSSGLASDPGTTWNRTGVDLSDFADGDLIVICFGVEDAAAITIDSISITGFDTISAKHTQNEGAGFRNVAAIWAGVANTAGSASATISTTFSTSPDNVFQHVFRGVGLDPATVWNDGQNGTSVNDRSVTPSWSGDAVSVYVSSSGNTGSFTWSGATEVADDSGGSSSSGAAMIATPGSPPGTVTMSQSGMNRGVIAGVAFALASGAATYNESVSLGSGFGLAQTSIGTMGGSASMGVLTALTAASTADMDAVAALAAGMGVSSTAGLLLTDSVSFGAASGFDTSRTAVIPVLASFGAQTAVAGESQLDAVAQVSLAAALEQALASQAVFGSDLTFSTVASLASAGGSIYADAISLAAGTGLSVSAQQSLVGAIALGIAAAQTSESVLTVEEAVTLAANAGYSANSVITIEEAAAFALAASIASQGGVDAQTYNEAIALGVSALIASAASHDATGSVQIGASVSAGQGSQTEQNVAVELSAAVSEAVTAALEISQSIDLDVSGGLTLSGSRIVEGTISLGSDLATTAVSSAVLVGGVSFSVQFDEEASSQLDAEEAIDLAIAAVLQSDWVSGNEIYDTIDLSGIAERTVSLSGTAERTVGLTGTMQITIRLNGRLN